jgi:DNA-binding HxlR family transcriptional regulator
LITLEAVVASCNHQWRILLSVLKSDYFGQSCSIARALEAIGERWTLLIIRELLRRPRRFADLERKLGVAKNVLSTRLAKLTELEIVEKIPYTDARDWNEYRLTEKGQDLFYVVQALMAWGDRYEAPDGAPAVFEHECGHPAGHKVVCERCGEVVTAANVDVIAGPGLSLT